MRYLFIFVILSLHAFEDITKEGLEQYQDIIINGKVAKKANYNHDDCETRYQIIKPILERYNRNFTMIDLGCAQGYYSLKAAHEYPSSTFVMLEGNNQVYPKIGNQLQSICIDNTALKNIILLNQRIRPEDITHMAKCEHFDVVLALNILHWFGDQWKELATAIVNLGHDIIIETPPCEKNLEANHVKVRNEIFAFLEENEAQIIGSIPRHTQKGLMANLYHIRGKRDRLEYKNWLGEDEDASQKDHIIVCDYNTKKLIKKDRRYGDHTRTTDWVPGINMMTFLMNHGTYPENKTLEKAIRNLKDVKTSDWMINNMVIQGHNIEMIDLEDIYHKQYGGVPYGERLLKETLKMLNSRDRAAVEKQFRKRVCKVYW
ncbi:MAG: class I SAM-dependent methyltransferase [Simkaniaceae bacterium]|nr:class I SAM-dependent methyltransferase [Simkaniaceae bacterium]